MKTVRELAAALPRELTSFEGSQYALPLCQAVFGRLPTADEARARLDEVRDLLPPDRLPATDRDAATLEELDAHLRARSMAGCPCGGRGCCERP